MKLKYLLAASIVSLAATTTIATPVFAQETTSSVRGTVTDDAGNPVVGATVTVTHVPSGTTSTQTTDAEGGFNAAGLRLGGPFTVEVAADGFETASQDIGNLTAGQAQRISVALAAQGQTIVVTGARARSAITLSTGPATVLSARDIAGVANVGRDIRNLAARDPLVNLDATNGNAISIAGQNNRFNRFTVDGVAFGDPFGLESGGLVSARGPVPLDAIGEFSVETAPVDIQQGFFQGGAINTQLKSGGNRFTFLGGAYYQDDSLRGTKARALTRVGAFESKIFTAQVTGPIIKDKLFFAVTYERTRDTVPADVAPSQLGLADTTITQINDIAKNVYSFDTLGVASNITEKDDKLVTKLDWNVADGHRLTATYIWNEASLLAGQTGTGQIVATNPTYNLLSNNYTQGAKNHFGIIQSTNQWTDNFSTVLRVSYADYIRLQEPYGTKSFGQFQVCLDPTNPAPPPVTTPPQPANGSASLVCAPGRQRLNFGPDISRQANELDSQSLNIEFAATLKAESHTFKLIAERRRQDVRNLFAQRVSGAWYFDSVADLQARRANEVDIAVPLRGGIDTVTADFQNNSWTFGLMDTIDVTDTLTVVAGVRYDLFDTPDRPFRNDAFLGRFGFSNTANLNGRDLLQPRFGVNWKPTDRLQVRGSAGLFGGGNPLVWISNNYSNPGPTLGRVQVRRTPGATPAQDTYTIAGITGLTAAQVNAIGAATLNNVSGGTGIPQSLIDAIRTTGTAASPTNALDPNFEPPSQWRFSGSVDYEANLGFFGDGWNFGADVIYSKVNNALEWTDLRSVANGTLPDGRQRYNILAGQTGVNTDILLTNTDFGDSWNIVGRFNKRWDSGLFLNGAYTYGDVTDQSPGTSSVAFSNYQNTAVGIDSNFAATGISNYQRDSQFRLGGGFDGEIFGENNTRIELFYNVRSGQRYSYTYNDQAAGSNRSTVLGVTGRNSAGLLYVPNVSSISADPKVSYAPGFDFTGFQNFILNSELKDYQGQIAPKNIAKTPWVHKLDLAVRQEVPFVFGGKLELSMEMENVLNFIDKDWGTIRQVGFPYNASVVNVACLTAAQGTPGSAVATVSQPCAQYQYSNRTGTTFAAPVEATQINGSLWGVRFGVRVKF